MTRERTRSGRRPGGLALLATAAGAGLLALAPAAAGQAPEGDDHGSEPGARAVAEPRPRLAVSDGARGRVTVLDLATRRPLARIPLARPGRLLAAGAGRHALAVLGDANRVDVIDGGSWSVEHGDHEHHYVRAPRRRVPILGPKPSHVVPHGERVGIFHDGSGVATVIDLHDIGRGSAGALRVPTGAGHHGVGVPLGARTAVTLPPAVAGELPSGVGVADARGRIRQRFPACPLLHGEAAVGATSVLFACADGYLRVTAAGARVTSRGIAGLPGGEASRSFTLSSAPGLPYAIGDLADDSFVRVDLTAGTSTALTIPAEHGAFALDGESRSLLTVATDGRLLQVDPASGAVTASVRVARPYSLEGPFTVPRPQIALGHERRVYVSDPSRGVVVEVATNPLRVTRGIRVGGRPTTLAVLGGEAHAH